MLRDKDYEFLKFAFLKEFILDSARHIGSTCDKYRTVFDDITYWRKNTFAYVYYTNNYISQITGMPEGTIKSHISRGKAKMAKLLGSPN